MVREALRLLEEHDLNRAARLADFNQELARRLESLDTGRNVKPPDARERLKRKSDQPKFYGVSADFFSEDADLDLDDIREYIAQDIDAGDRWIAKLFDAFKAVGRSPGIGHKREDLTDIPLLFFPVGACLIVSRAIRSMVEIVAATQDARGIPSFLRRRISP